MSLTTAQLDAFADNGHLTVPDVFDDADMDRATADAMAWSEETLAGLSAEDAKWYLDAGTSGQYMRKLDNPVHYRRVFRELAAQPALLEAVGQLAGGDELTVYFSQIFFKPPEGGGPKPIHQDNFYFGPSDADGMVTAWIALDEATVENGCLYYADGSHRQGLIDHVAPEAEPFNLQLPAETAAAANMTAAPVSRGGVSFHHGITLHGSGDNLSSKWRRAVAFHYVRNGVTFVTPAWGFDPDMAERIS
jgi:phytanoyl-CoA hydroxylase